MELRQLHHFVAVAEEGNFTRGAQRVHVVQSAVSASVQKLERHLGTELFDRSGPVITLTDAGAALLPRARAILASVRQARDTVDEVRAGLRGTIRLGTLVATFPVDVPALIGRFHQTHPRVMFQLRTPLHGTRQHLLDVADGSLDIAVVNAAWPTPADVRLQHLLTVPLRLVCPPGHRLIDATTVSLDQLAGERFIDWAPGWGIRAVVDRAFAAAGLSRAIAFEVSDVDNALGLVRLGLGVAFLPHSDRPEFRHLTFVDVSGADLDLPYALATRSPEAGLSPAVAALAVSILSMPLPPPRGG